jgi:hypothetical protein
MLLSLNLVAGYVKIKVFEFICDLIGAEVFFYYLFALPEFRANLTYNLIRVYSNS